MKQLDTNLTFHPVSKSKSSAPHRDSPASPMLSGRSFCVQQFTGTIDLHTVADFVAALDRILGQRPEGVVVDLGRVTFLSASGLGVLVRFGEEAARLGLPVAVVGGISVTRPLRACAPTPTLDIHDSLESAGWAVVTSAAGR
ncbi:STAS domain-containing protein [Gordonia polyisoprenivorans]|uniref:STAS domain-containing protein n=1 Tax=Gordonia polyisoprenivorans TaxID=84595 RepID=UPI000B99E314|nr:STAS domain-containing protein [Gordonia polyisoprenivorans]OZC32629.1 anti-anti-sigma factor [Gordonia polyisoprenivorans]